MYKIDIHQKKVIDTITLKDANGTELPVRFWDMAIDKSGEYFYAMLLQDGDNDSDFNNDKFAKIKISDGTITTIGHSHADLPSYIALIFSDAEGKVVALAQDGKMYEVMPQSGKLYLTRPFSSLTFYNDGTSCSDANITLPPHPPRLSINDVRKAEGDSGETTFNFTVTADKMFDMMPMSGVVLLYKVIDGDGNMVVPPHEVALSSDHDFKTQNDTITMAMSMFSKKINISIPVTVYGDKKVEADEEFYVEIYAPQIGMGMSPKYWIDKNIGVGTILNDDLKLRVERTNSQNSQTELEKKSLYTQISGRDFDYAIASYNNENNGSKLEDMTLKIELIDNDAMETNNSILYTGYQYITSTERMNVIVPDDLAIPIATKDTSFKIYFLKDNNGTILHGDYSNPNAYNNQKNRAGYQEIGQNASDHFAIRPANFLISIKDIDENNNSLLYGTNSSNSSTPLDLVAEYPYLIEANATLYGSTQKAPFYSTDKINSTLIFSGSSHCNDDANRTFNYSFTNGNLSATLFNNNAGKYRLDINDTNWTAIDQDANSLGCILDSASNTPDNEGKVGCNIASKNTLAMLFKPFSFTIDTALSNIHNGKNHLYMSDLNLSKEMGVELNSTITAKGKNGGRLSNFTKGCIEENPTLTAKLRFAFEDDRGTWDDSNMTFPQSIKGQPLAPQQIVAFNEENLSVAHTEMIQNITIAKEDFKDDNNGSMKINTLYNMEKLFNKPTNPIKVDFVSLDLNTTDLEAKMRGEANQPHGKGNINATRIFYFSRVSSYLKHYPATDKESIHTPLFVEVYCRTKTPSQDWCRDTMKLTANGIIRNGNRTYKGWYLNTGHDSATEGEVTTLKVIKHTQDVVTNYASIPHNFVNGKIDKIQTSLTTSLGDDEIKAKIELVTSEWLRFNKKSNTKNGFYTVTFKPAGQLVGVSKNTDGDIGYNLMRDNNGSLNGMVEKNGKMSW